MTTSKLPKIYKSKITGKWMLVNNIERRKPDITFADTVSNRAFILRLNRKLRENLNEKLGS